MPPSYLLHGSSINTRETSSKKLYLSLPHATQVPTPTVVNLEAEGGLLMHSSLLLLVYQPFHLGVPLFLGD